MTMNYAFFVLLRATPAWLALPRERRRELAAEHLGTILQKHEGQLRMRYFDAEAFSAVCSDVMLTETDDPRHHYFFIEQLRDTPLLHVPYFEVTAIVPAIEEGYRAFEEASAS